MILVAALILIFPLFVLYSICTATSYRMQGGAKSRRMIGVPLEPAYQVKWGSKEKPKSRRKKLWLNSYCEKMLGPCTCGAWHHENELEELAKLQPKPDSTPKLRVIRGDKE